MLVTKSTHPYKNHPEPLKWDEDRLDEIDELYEWYVNRISCEKGECENLIDFLFRPRGGHFCA
jgi:hypothetical protein